MRTFILVALALLLRSGSGFAFDCAAVKLPSSLVICSDPDLIRLADARQEAFTQAMARLDPQQQKELLADQNGWVRSYATACGAAPDAPAPNPVSDAMRECFKRAAQARVTYIRAYGLPAGGAQAASTDAATQTAAAVPTPLLPSPAQQTATTSSAPATPQIWWWCPLARAYYPQVQICPTGTWQRVGPFQPQPQARKPFWTPDGQFNTGGASAAEINAAVAEHERQQEAKEAAEREAREAKARIVRAEAERRYQVAVSEQERITRERGYKLITFQDFILDGKELALSDAKVAIKGVYIKQGDTEMLSPSTIALLMAQQTFNTNAGIGLLTEDAPRNIRKYFLDCQNNLVAAAQGCPVTALGRATMCERTSFVSSTSVPCVAVDDGWYVGQDDAESVRIAPAPQSTSAVPPLGAGSTSAAATTPPIGELSRAYAEGLADRQAWERYFDGLSGQTKEGAEYWAAHRSVPGSSCQPTAAEQQGQWQIGCLSAKLQLDPTDRRRVAEPDYRTGWNAYVALPSQPVASPAASPPPAATTTPTAEPSPSAGATAEARWYFGRFLNDTCVPMKAPFATPEDVVNAFPGLYRLEPGTAPGIKEYKMTHGSNSALLFFEDQDVCKAIMSLISQ